MSQHPRINWRLKSISQVQAEYERGELKRALGPVHLILLGVGCIIGAGIFVRTGNAAALYAGPAVMISFAIAGFVCALAALCYAELASALPVSGSAYTYSYTTIGEFGAWIMGSLLLLEYGLSASMIAVGWSGYAVSLLRDLGVHFPAAYSQALGKFVVSQVTNVDVLNPLVILNGLTAHLTDGSAVQFLTSNSARLTGTFQTTLNVYDLVSPVAGGYALSNAVDITLQQDTQAVLTAAASVLDPITTQVRTLASGTAVIASAGSLVEIPAGSSVPLAAAHVAASVFNVPAAVVVLAAASLLIFGVSASATVNNVIVGIKMAVILAFVAVGAFHVKTSNWHPFIPDNTGQSGEFGWSGVLRAATIVFFAYLGFEAVSTAAQESKNPQRDMPLGILGSLAVCTILYMATAVVLTGVISFTKLNVAAPVAVAVDSFGPQWGWLAESVKIAAILGLSSVILALIFAQTRVLYTMSRDGLMPRALALVHPHFKTPWINTLVVGVAIALAAAIFDINTLGDLTAVGTLAAFAMVCMSVIWLRRARPDLPRHFRTPFYPITPLLGMICCLLLITRINDKVLHFFASFITGSIVLYFLYGYWTSPMRRRATSPTQVAARPARECSNDKLEEP